VIESSSTSKTITAVTVNNRLRKRPAFMNWSKANGYVTDNPLVGLKVMMGSAKEAWFLFEQHDLAALLNLDALKTEASLTFSHS
jgi:hypothetical protein